MDTVVVDSIAAYADGLAGALRRPADDAFPHGLPVLDPANTDPSRVTGGSPAWEPSDAGDVMRWHEAVRGTTPGATGAVLGFGPADWALPAMLHAALNGRPFRWFDDPADLVAAAAGVDGPVTVCAPPGLLSRVVQDGLTAALSFTVEDDGLSAIAWPSRPLSYLTARTLPVLTRVVVAHRRRRSEHDSPALGLFPELLVGVADDDRLTCLSGDDLTAAAVRAAPRPDLMMMWGHSREDLFHLNKDALCGWSAEADDATAPDDMVPTCVSAGACVKAGDILPVHQVGAGALLFGGCNIMRLGAGGLFARQFSLAFTALEGGASVVVAPAGVVIGSPIEFLFLYRLLRGGLPVGESVRLLNAALPLVGPDSPSYLVLGEGDRTLFQPPAQRATVHRQREADGWRVEFRDVDAEYLAVDVPDFHAGLRVRLGPGTPRRPALYSTVVPTEGGGARIFLYGSGRLRTDALVVDIGTDRRAADHTATVGAALANLQAYGKLLLRYQGKLKSLEPEWRSASSYLIRQRARARYDPQAGAAADRRAAAVEQAVHAMDESLCRHYLERAGSAQGFTFHEQCLFEDETFTVTGHDITGPCPYCGDRMMGRALRSAVLPAVGRMLGICHTCGTIWDRPADASPPVLAIDPVLRPGTPQPVVLRLHNALDRQVRGWAGVTVRRARQFGYVVEPEMRELTLGPGESADAAFSVRTTSVPTDAEFLRGYWSSELALTVAQRTIWTARDGARPRRPVSDGVRPPQG